jgi:hypothetical protein
MPRSSPRASRRTYHMQSRPSPVPSLGRLDNLCLRRRWQLGAEDAVPETAGDAEAVFVVGEMVLEVVFL